MKLDWNLKRKRERESVRALIEIGSQLRNIWHGSNHRAVGIVYMLDYGVTV